MNPETTSFRHLRSFESTRKNLYYTTSHPSCTFYTSRDTFQFFASRAAPAPALLSAAKIPRVLYRSSATAREKNKARLPEATRAIDFDDLEFAARS